MSEPIQTSSVTGTETIGATEKRWPAVYALVTAWILPATTTRRTNHMRLISAWGVHLIALVLAYAAILVTDAAESGRYRGRNAPLMVVVYDRLEDTFKIARYQTSEVMLRVVATAAGIEGSLILGAFVLMPFGARDESFSDSLRHALRRTWLHSGHAALLILLVGLILVETRHALTDWFSEGHYLYRQTQSDPPAPSDATPDQRAEHNRRIIEQLPKRWDFIRSRPRPFIVRYADEVATCSVIAAGFWFAWALLRGLGAERPFQRPAHPRICRACGYSLIGLPDEGRCPECGFAIRNSIGAQVAQDTQREHVEAIDRVADFVRTLGMWIRRPSAAAMRLNLNASGAHRMFLWVNLVACGVLAFIGISLTYAANPYYRSGFSAPPPKLIVPIIGASIWTLALLLITSLAALVPAFVALARDRRNILGGTCQVACYTSGWWLIWTGMLALVLAVCEFRYLEWIAPLAGRLKIPGPELVGLIVAVLSGLFGVTFLVQVYRASAGARYACR